MVHRRLSRLCPECRRWGSSPCRRPIFSNSTLYLALTRLLSFIKQFVAICICLILLDTRCKDHAYNNWRNESCTTSKHFTLTTLTMITCVFTSNIPDQTLRGHWMLNICFFIHQVKVLKVTWYIQQYGQHNNNNISDFSCIKQILMEA